MINNGLFNDIKLIKNSYIPDYRTIQTFIPRSKKKRIIIKCKKKYIEQRINEPIYMHETNTIICSNFMYEQIRRSSIWKN